ncbi:MAG: phage virion morphogenesis protein [Deltaproteobacteria bacterium]|nr:phage virion morphogenesis protein [Deltaproteobacteria bacterium]
MTDTIGVKIDDREVVEALRRLERQAGDLRPVMREIAGDMLDSVQENFARQGRPLRWKPSRRARKQGGQTLRDTNRLYRSIIARSDTNGAMVGTNVRYAAIHHFGGEIKHPARERVLHFRQVERGRMTHARPGTGDTFAKSGKAHYAMKVKGKAYTIKMPARPFMVLDDSDVRRIVMRIGRHLFPSGGNWNLEGGRLGFG